MAQNGVNRRNDVWNWDALGRVIAQLQAAHLAWRREGFAVEFVAGLDFVHS